MKDIFDYDVCDRNGEKVGSVDKVWADEDREIGFIGIRTGFLGLGKNHLIPAQDITIDEDDKAIHLPYDEELIKSSPSFDSHDDLEDSVESRVRSHFGITEWQRGKEQEADYDSATDESFPDKTSAAEYRGRQAAGEYAEGETVEVPLAQEGLQIERRQLDLGGVRLRKVILTETVIQPGELRREDVEIERVSGTQGTPGSDAFTEKVVSIPISEEEAVVHKTVESAGAIRAHKVVENEQENVTEAIRKEDVEVEREQEHAHHDH